MRKDSAFIFIISLSITVGVIGGLYYLNVVKPVGTKNQRVSSKKSVSSAVTQPAGLPAPIATRSNQILKCVDPEIGEFYTNAKDCGSADLNNRLSRAQNLEKVDYISRDARETRREIQKGANKNPNIRQVAKVVPDGLSVSCSFAIGRALEIERMLSAADEASESIWVDDYCKQVNDSRTESCNVTRDFFYYGFLCG